MFFTLSVCASDREMSKLPLPRGAVAADTILGFALLIIGIVATQVGFLPHSVQYAFIGAGAAYFFGMLCFIGIVIRAIRGGSEQGAGGGETQMHYESTELQ